jgi:hypothetical protein
VVGTIVPVISDGLGEGASDGVLGLELGMMVGTGLGRIEGVALGPLLTAIGAGVGRGAKVAAAGEDPVSGKNTSTSSFRKSSTRADSQTVFRPCDRFVQSAVYLSSPQYEQD